MDYFFLLHSSNNSKGWLKMITKVKTELLKNPDSIISILNHFNFYHIELRHNEVRFANSIDGSKNAIHMKLDENLFTKDFARDYSGDIFSFIMKARNVPFKEVFSVSKTELGMTDYEFKKRIEPFNGLFSKVKKNKSTLEYKVYSDNILSKYDIGYSKKFIDDHINIQTQRKFGIRYDTSSSSIVIPIRDPVGELMGCKLRRNYKVSDDESKYIYAIPCPASQTLFGYSLNYDSLYGSDILIGEAEKFVMQCDSYGFKNAVGIGSSSLSIQQCKLLLSLNPNSLSFMLDVGLDKSVLEKNMSLVKNYAKMINIPVYYWTGEGFEDKMSPTDKGKELFIEALNNRREFVNV